MSKSFRCKNILLTRHSVNEIFDPSRVNSFYSEAADTRQQANSMNRCTNYGVVRLGLIERVYETLYMQRLLYGNDESSWPHQILSQATVIGIPEPLDDSKVRIAIRRPVPGSQMPPPGREGCFIFAKSWAEEQPEFDAVILGTGYQRNAYRDLLSSVESLRAGDCKEASSDWKVRRDYSIEFAPGVVKDGCGIWLQGCCEESHGVRPYQFSFASDLS